MAKAALFAFESVSVGPPDARRLDGLDAELPDGGLTVIAGPSGSGKSTLLRLCNRLEVPSAGIVRHRGTDVTERDPLELRREVAMVFERPVTFAGTVRDNLHEAETARSTTTRAPSCSSAPASTSDFSRATPVSCRVARRSARASHAPWRRGRA